MTEHLKSTPVLTLCLFIATLSLLIGSANAAAPTAAFSGTPTSGTAPLAVTFTDASTGGPTGWAWFFGDETYGEAWTEVNASAEWGQRVGHTSVTLPDGSIVFMGGQNFGAAKQNDVWRSADNGTTWTQVNASAGWAARSYHSSVALPDGSIVLMGGQKDGGLLLNDVWRSVDAGGNWTEVNASAGWAARYKHTSVALSNGSIVLMGGQKDGGLLLNDVWRSTDAGATWTQVNANAGWEARYSHASAALSNGSIVLMGGTGASGPLNDVWRLADNETTWTQVNASAGWTARSGHSSLTMPDGSIVLAGGSAGSGFRNDVWRSTDAGATWVEVNASAGWPERGWHASAAARDSSILIMGGASSFGPKSDVWRLQPAGSTEQNPTHTYTAPGTYSVTLQIFNADGYDAIRTTGYVTVTALVTPTAAFNGTPTSGTAPLTVHFTDESTGSPIVWNWSFGDGAWFNTTNAAERNATHTYSVAGAYTVNLTVSNAGKSNALSRAGYITVTAPTPTPTPTSRPPSSSGGGSTGGPGGYNVGGNSAVSKVTVTGTGLEMLIVTGRVQSSPGAGIPPVPGTPYQYIDLVPARFTEITGANITFTVQVAWLAEHNLTAEEVVMYHYNGTAWEALPTWVVDETGSTVTFTATSPGFSLFAISGVEQPEEAVTTPTVAATTEPTAAQTTARAVAEQTAAAPAAPVPDFPLGTVALVGGVILVLIGAGYLIRRWWIRRQNPALFRDYD